MSISAIVPGTIFQIPPFPVRRFTVDEYHCMIQVGILTEDDDVELLEGWIVPKTPHNPLHDAVIDQAQESLQAVLPAGWRVRVQSAITTPTSEPELDLAIVRGPASRYRTHHPGPADIALVIEVADSSLTRDREEKGPLYAGAGLPHYWIINLTTGQIETYQQPASTGYLQRQDHGPGETISLPLPEQAPIAIAVVDLFVSDLS